MTAPVKKHATYEDVLNAPPHMVAEVLGGELHLQPRLAKPHAAAATALGEELGPPFKRGRGGPGGWVILDEPELHLGADIVVPDLAGWRVERMPELVDDEPYFSLAPDWVCEVLSPRTAKYDRSDKMNIYARERVRWAWLVDPLQLRWRRCATTTGLGRCLVPGVTKRGSASSHSTPSNSSSLCCGTGSFCASARAPAAPSMLAQMLARCDRRGGLTQPGRHSLGGCWMTKEYASSRCAGRAPLKKAACW